MSKFICQAETVEAFRYTEEIMPGWWTVWAMQNPGKFDYLKVQGKLINNKPFTQLHIHTHACIIVARPGDYVYQDRQGDIFVMKKEVFEQFFTKMEMEATESSTPSPHFHVETESALRATLLDKIDEERVRQDAKWGTAFDDKNTPNDWTTSIMQHLAKAAPLKFDSDMFEHQMIKVASIAVAAIETMHRNSGLRPRHYDF